jgi:hypothetical protein
MIGLAITNAIMPGALHKAAAIVYKGAMLEPFPERFGRLTKQNTKTL